ncbi:MAG: hypothetical protein ACYCW6_07275 [Candidatus Xenobia bacterium]
MSERFPHNPILRPCDVRPSRDDFEVTCLLNPGAFRFRGRTGLLLRVAERPVQRPGYVSVPVLKAGAMCGARLRIYRPHLVVLQCQAELEWYQMLRTTIVRLYGACILLMLMIAVDCGVVREMAIRRDLRATLDALGRSSAPATWCRMYGPLTHTLQQTRNLNEALALVRRLPRAHIIRETPDSLFFSLQFGLPSWSGLFCQEVDVDVAWDHEDTLVRIDRDMAFY